MGINQHQSRAQSLYGLVTQTLLVQACPMSSSHVSRDPREHPCSRLDGWACGTGRRGWRTRASWHTYRATLSGPGCSLHSCHQTLHDFDYCCLPAVGHGTHFMPVSDTAPVVQSLHRIHPFQLSIRQIGPSLERTGPGWSGTGIVC